mmetsp:Transcript_104535/g.312175  ORF Transcript_104535/g.312175 Transcript_104535/m.312175 type:complete len:247 (+) Transcript_104535:635-1375(+)
MNAVGHTKSPVRSTSPPRASLCHWPTLTRTSPHSNLNRIPCCSAASAADAASAPGAAAGRRSSPEAPLGSAVSSSQVTWPEAPVLPPAPQNCQNSDASGGGASTSSTATSPVPRRSPQMASPSSSRRDSGACLGKAPVERSSAQRRAASVSCMMRTRSQVPALRPRKKSVRRESGTTSSEQPSGSHARRTSSCRKVTEPPTSGRAMTMHSARSARDLPYLSRPCLPGTPAMAGKNAAVPSGRSPNT